MIRGSICCHYLYYLLLVYIAKMEEAFQIEMRSYFIDNFDAGSRSFPHLFYLLYFL